MLRPADPAGVPATAGPRTAEPAAGPARRRLRWPRRRRRAARRRRHLRRRARPPRHAGRRRARHRRAGPGGAHRHRLPARVRGRAAARRAGCPTSPAGSPVLVVCLLGFALGSLVTASATVAAGGRGRPHPAGARRGRSRAPHRSPWSPTCGASGSGARRSASSAPRRSSGRCSGRCSGAAVLAVADWRAIFWLNLTVALVLAATLPLTAARTRPPARDRHSPGDRRGARSGRAGSGGTRVGAPPAGRARRERHASAPCSCP